MSDLNNSADDYQDSRLIEEKIRSLQDELEGQKQENYTLHSKIKLLEQMQQDYDNDLAAMEKIHSEKLKSQEDTSQAIISQLTEELSDWKSRVEDLEEGLTKSSEAHAHEIREFKQRMEGSEQKCTDLAALQAELQEMLKLQENDRRACEQHKDLIQLLQHENFNLKSELDTVKEELEISQGRLTKASGDLLEITDILDQTRGSLAIAENELACLKAKPSTDGSRGNSLFAEVEDKRQAMAKRCVYLTSKYNSMKDEYSSKCAEIAKLRAENLNLCRKFEKEAEERNNMDISLKINYEKRIEELEQALHDSQKSEKAIFIEGDNKILKYAEQFVGNTRAEIIKLREEMEWRSAERLSESKELFKLRKEMQSVRAQFITTQSECNVLSEKCKQMETELEASKSNSNDANELKADLDDGSERENGAENTTESMPASLTGPNSQFDDEPRIMEILAPSNRGPPKPIISCSTFQSELPSKNKENVKSKHVNFAQEPSVVSFSDSSVTEKPNQSYKRKFISTS